MARNIYVNLPVSDLSRSMAFFTRLGFAFDPEFTDENAAGMIVAENINVMLLTQSFFQTFTPKRICDASKQTEVLICLSCDSQAEVDELVAKAVAGGGKAAREAKDHGFMYEHAFEDPDGHIWELVYFPAEGTEEDA